MKILILGGRQFLGRALVATARELRLDVTLLNRGRTNPELYQNEIHIMICDRDALESFGPLKNKTWDAVIDTCSYFPDSTELSCRFFKERTDHYTLISTISVYDEWWKASNVNESFKRLAPLKAPENRILTMDLYGGLKAACEDVVHHYFPDRHLTIRPGLIVGPHDPTDRFTYWIWRFQQRISYDANFDSNEVLAPGNPLRTVQFIDVRDLAEFILLHVQKKSRGYFNVTGPVEPITMQELLETIQHSVASDLTLRWVPEGLLQEASVAPFTEIPLWLPEVPYDPVDISRAIAHELKCRPVSQTIRDTAEWIQQNPRALPLKNGLSPEKERQLLAQSKS